MRTLKLLLVAMFIISFTSCEKESVEEGVTESGGIIVNEEDLVNSKDFTLRYFTSSEQFQVIVGDILVVDYLKFNLTYNESINSLMITSIDEIESFNSEIEGVELVDNILFIPYNPEVTFYELNVKLK